MAEPNGEFPIPGTLLIKHSQKTPDRTQLVFVTETIPPRIRVLGHDRTENWYCVKELEPGIYERARGGCRFFDPKIVNPDELKRRLGFAEDMQESTIEVAEVRREKRDQGTRRISLGDVGL